MGGGGSLSYWLSKKNALSNFTLVDYLEDAISISKEINRENSDRFSFYVGNIYDLKIDKKFDFVFCWQALMCLDRAEKALNELIDITKDGGFIYISSLFNVDFDVDIYSRCLDHTTPAGRENVYCNYNTYSLKTISNWLENKVSHFKVHKFDTNVDFDYKGRGLGTFCEKILKNKSVQRIQISGGMLMNWGILEIQK
ncbi:biotin biosynthesis protein BioC [Campylobacter sputorum subsp. sputorum]|uniref:Biotin biosynthesis protein BioC n=1 Tax=Campylobacter sputorum subsp. sputorum TaxID=32024 RepID=A0A381DJ61_9BACT|nr:biotin biosynthesis protein BioC [Campylobacter sputorum subsp. sputorum]